VHKNHQGVVVILGSSAHPSRKREGRVKEWLADCARNLHRARSREVYYCCFFAVDRPTDRICIWWSILKKEGHCKEHRKDDNSSSCEHSKSATDSFVFSPMQSWLAWHGLADVQHRWSFGPENKDWMACGIISWPELCIIQGSKIP